MGSVIDRSALFVIAPKSRGDHAVRIPLAAALQPPPLPPTTLPRRALCAALEAASTKHVVTLIAPAGSGKSLLMAHWYKKLPSARRAWLTVDPRTTNAATLFAHLAAALQITDVASVDGHCDAHGFAVQLEGRAGEPLHIVLDDTHWLNAATAVELDYLIKRTPDSVHWYLVGRCLPNINLTELNLQQRHAFISAAQLDLEPAQIVRFARALGFTAFNEDDAQRIYANTEGWFAGVRLALTSYYATLDANDAALDIYFGALLRDASDELREFLLTVCIVERLDAELCDALLHTQSSRSSSRQLLEMAERAQLFMRRVHSSSQNGEARRYRVHPLFLAHLRRALQRDKPSRIPDLHLRASRFFAYARRFEESLTHAQAANHRTWLVEATARAARHWVKSGAIIEALTWTQKLTLQELLAHESLWTAHVTCLILTRRFTQAATILNAVHGGAASGKLRTLKAMLGLLSNRAADLDLAEQCFSEIANVDSELTGTLMNLQAYWFMKEQRFEAARRRALQARECLEKHGCHYGATHANAILCASLGALYRNRAVIEFAEQGYAQHADAPRDAVWANAAINLAYVRYEQNRLPEALELCQTALPLLSGASSLQNFAMAHMLLARVHSAEGRAREAEVLLDDLHGYLETGYFPLGLANVCLEKIRLYLQLGRLRDAEQVAQEFDLDGRELRSEWSTLSAGATAEVAATTRFGCAQALRLLYLGQYERCERSIEHLLAHATAIGYTQRAVTLTALRASLLARTGKLPAAIATLNEALKLTLSTDNDGAGFTRNVYDDVPDLSVLVAQAADAGQLQPAPAPAHFARFESLFPGAAPRLPRRARSIHAAPLEPLTDREMTVLRLLAQGLSNQQICQRSNIAITTAKWHLKNIFAKLDVGTRTAALARARTLRLID